MFSKPLSPFEELRTNKSRRIFLVLKWTTNSRRDIKNLFRPRQRENKKILWTRPRKWQAKIQPNKTEKRQRRKCQSRLSQVQKKKWIPSKTTYGPWKHEKEYAACNRPESWYLENHKTELNLNSISETWYLSYINRDIKLPVLSLGGSFAHYQISRSSFDSQSPIFT